MQSFKKLILVMFFRIKDIIISEFWEKLNGENDDALFLLMNEFINSEFWEK